MATNVVHEFGTDHLKAGPAIAAHLAGDLVYYGGFYGVVSDNVKVGDYFTLRLRPTANLPRVPSTLAMGTKVYAPATEQATTLPIAGGATTGYNPIGRTIATGTATTAKIQLFNPNNY